MGLPGLVAGWLQDRLPSAVQGRVRMSGGHVMVVALLAVTGLTVTGWVVTRADGVGSGTVPVTSASVPVGAAASSAAAPGPSGEPPGSGSVSSPALTPLLSPSAQPEAASAAPPVGPAAPSASSTASVVVDVTGKVRRPGIATLPAGSRVVDALQAAGGPRRGARLAALNLARVLTDGEQVVVGVPPPPGVAAGASSAATAGPPSGSTTGTPLVNINTATQSELEELPGIGPVTARSILDFRAENGTFTAVDELLEVSGIGDATLAELAPFVTL